MRLPALLVLSLACFASIGSVAAQESRPPLGAQAVLTPGDSVRLVVWGKPDYSGDFVVAPDGSITHPLYRSVRVGGVPFATAEGNVRAFLTSLYANPQFVLEPLVRVAVSGEVNRPQLFALRPETTIAEAVARAGGTNQYAARNRIRVLRLGPSGRQEQLLVDLADPNGAAGSFLVRSGDQILVERKKSFLKDVFLPALGVVGSIASVGLLVERTTR